MYRVTRKMVDQQLETLNTLGQELGLEGAGEWIVANQHGTTGADQSLLRQFPENHSISTRTALGEHTWRGSRECVAGLRGLIAGLRAASSN